MALSFCREHSHLRETNLVSIKLPGCHQFINIWSLFSGKHRSPVKSPGLWVLGLRVIFIFSAPTWHARAIHNTQYAAQCLHGELECRRVLEWIFSSVIAGRSQRLTRYHDHLLLWFLPLRTQSVTLPFQKAALQCPYLIFLTLDKCKYSFRPFEWVGFVFFLVTPNTCTPWLIVILLSSQLG